MIAESPRTLLILLAVLTWLGGVMGYCIALVFAKRAARKAIEAARLESGPEKLAAEPDLQAARSGLAKLRSVDDGNEAQTHDEVEHHDNVLSIQRNKAQEAHSRLQSERIRSLESQLATLKDKQHRLKSDFASYKSEKLRELELAKGSVGQWAGSAKLPTLSRKVDSQAARDRTRQSIGLGVHDDVGTLDHGVDILDKLLSSEIDIPALAESELPDSTDPLNLDMSEAPGNGARGRG
ncbi:MAG: hypothetical protein AB8B97_23620 [Granulosicoccus sp.]